MTVGSTQFIRRKLGPFAVIAFTQGIPGVSG